MKTCSKCKIIKDENDFNKNKSKLDGRSTECKLCVKEYNKKYREGHKDTSKIYLAKYNQLNKQQLYEQKKEYIANNKAAHLHRQHNWYIKNIDEIKTRVSKYKKDHPEQYQMYSNRRSASKKTNIVEKFSNRDIINIYNDHCFYCQRGKFEHIDHYIPLSKGGTHTLDNVRPSCERCNLTKSNKLPDEFLKCIRIENE